MDTVLVKLLTQAARAGTEFAIIDDQLMVRGTPPTPELRARHHDVCMLLLSESCAACNTDPWIREHATAIPWCRPCARARGTQLLRAEHPELLEHAS